MREERNAVREQRGPGPLRLIWDWTRSLFFALILFLVVRAFLVEAFKIPTSSMEGTLLVGDFLLVNKAVYGAEVPLLGMKLPAWREPRRGDIVVFNPPHDPLKNYVKRVVGVPGDTLEMRDKALYVNGVEVNEEYARYIDRSGADAVHPQHDVAGQPSVGQGDWTSALTKWRLPALTRQLGSPRHPGEQLLRAGGQP